MSKISYYPIHITKRTSIGKEICVHSSNAVCAGLAKARMAAGYHRGATKQTLHVVHASASAAAVCGAVDVVAAVDCLSSPSCHLRETCIVMMNHKFKIGERL